MGPIIYLTSVFFGLALASDPPGMIGYGIKHFNPACASACAIPAQQGSLTCSTPGGMTFKENLMFMLTSPGCYASNTPYLTTVAYCIKQNCQGENIDLLEHFWRVKMTQTEGEVVPKWTYQQALLQVNGTPTGMVASMAPLNRTMLVSNATWSKFYNSFIVNEELEVTASKFSIIVVVAVLLLPILLTILSWTPKPTSLVAKFKSIFTLPALVGSKFRVPAWANLGIQPTRGIAFFILYIIVINVLASALHYPSTLPNVFYKKNAMHSAQAEQTIAHVALRMGLLSYANVALVILLSGRNNFLLWITNWSHSTYLLVKRWIAYVAILQAALHSLLYLRHFVAMDMYFFHGKLLWFIWGTVAMLSMTFIPFLGLLPIRQKSYEIFLGLHIVFSALSLIGMYLHVWYLYYNKWGFATWLYAAFAAWAFDRVFRLVRMAKWGMKRANITYIDDNYFQIDIPDVAMEGHAYLYFPTLTWRFWESHPFSIASSIQVCRDKSTEQPSPESRSSAEQVASDLEKYPDTITTKITTKSSRSTPSSAARNLTFFVRVHDGMTKHLANRIGKSLPVLVEGGYGGIHSLAAYPQLTAIVGGVGITTVLPLLRAHPGRARLFWGVKNEKLVAAVRATGLLDGIDVVEISVGRRLDLQAVLEMEIDGLAKEPAVVVSGPPGMADDVRSLTAKIMRKTGVNVKLIDESFSW